MAGIVCYGAYVPLYRLSGEVLAQVWGGTQKGERAVANVDEDSITMAVEAALDCLQDLGREQIDGLYFASTTPAYKEKLSASIVAAACDLREDIVTADFTDSLRAAANALQAALDATRASSAGTRCRVRPNWSPCARPGEPREHSSLLGEFRLPLF